MQLLGVFGMYFDAVVVEVNGFNSKQCSAKTYFHYLFLLSEPFPNWNFIVNLSKAIWTYPKQYELVKNYSGPKKDTVKWRLRHFFIRYLTCSCRPGFLSLGRNDESTLFLMVQTHNLRNLEVEHDLETSSRPWSTWILTLWASQGPENWKWNIRK